ncbi:MAG: c-type cytochrome [Deltaproteobacteria bacterium]|nr:c-type cytochrome [Deltaproteobacteria bacterium]MBW2395753.1 c-type cytochrome [Deltaproteobacteria bacterium]
MLSKSQARWFFVGGTVFFFAIFLFLTFDTLREIPARQNSEAMTESVVRGKHLWDAKNCMGCHTILGEGAYYAPELTRVVERRGKEWIAIFLRDPEAMFPGQRRMTQYDFSEGEIQDVVAFLDWIGGIDTNGFPATPDLGRALVVAIEAPTTAPEYFGTVCVACHTVAGSGGTVGPALDGVGNRMTRAELDRWLSDPQAVKPGTAMPNLSLPDTTRGELVDWLVSLR